ncbi:MAG: lipid hydroperoxide peroxidase [Candidatus Cloacimonadota bacterium]|nr:MAG: lipid hydroperoxide peroxidase [Candidatus Cloacimonadota bacterium]PIE79311.1 MAG: lipid hydroperoxide peroxidase [Candidatus Delongbacteria bacterium]
MAKVKIQGNEINTVGNIISVGSELPKIDLTKVDLSSLTNEDFKGKKVIFNIFPSIDTPTCAASVRRFNEEISKLENSICVCVSRDLPFAHARFCGAEGLENVVSASLMKSCKFGEDFGVKLVDGPLEGLLARSIVIADEEGKVTYTQLVPEITEEPNYEEALKAIK